MTWHTQILRFWNSHPALFYGIAILLGFYSAFYGFLNVSISVLLLFFPYFIALKQKIYIKPLMVGMLIFISSWIYGSAYHYSCSLPEHGIQGEAYIEIESLSDQTTYFGKNWVFRCHLRAFHTLNSQLSNIRNIKCNITLPQNTNIIRPVANQSYLIKGCLLQKNNHYFFKIDKNQSWFAIKGSWSLAEYRYKLKQSIIEWFKKNFSYPGSAAFLSGLITGEFDDRIMQVEFARFGLQHIMAISGFHFAIIAGILSFLLRFIVPRSIVAIGIILLLTIYYVFLGNSASILRAWLMIMIALLGEYFGKRGNALNSLGVALIVILMIDPLLSQTVGFQFSFLATAAILLCFTPFNCWFEYLLPKRPLSQMKDMNKWNQHGYCLLAFFRQGLALSLAINLFCLPLMLYYFHQFSYIGLFYNFFFPFFVSLSLFLLLIGLIFSFLFSPFGDLIHLVNNFYTKWILNLIYNLPDSVDAYLKLEDISEWFVIIYTSLIFIYGIGMKINFSRKQNKGDLIFL